MFLQEERLQLAAKTQFDRDEVRALAVKGMPGTRMSDGVYKSNLLCTYCQRKGHEEATCWTKNGYPEWWEHWAPHGGGRGSNRGARHPRFNGQHIERTANRGKTEATVAAISSGVGDSSTDVISGMTNTQWQKLIDLLGNPSIQNNRLNGPTYEDSDWSR